MRAMEGVFILIGSVLWGIAFFFGMNTGTWVLGKWGMFLIALAGLLRVTEFLIPNRKPQPKRSRGPARKCPVCGKPSTSGSKYCSYHARYGSEDDRR